MPGATLHHRTRSETGRRPAGRAVPALMLLLTIIGPISMDLYLPVLPALTAELGAAASMAQLTVTACLLGLAFGQVVAGPVSDRFGRRMPLVVGIAAYVITSALCALSPTVESLVLARFVQGLAGAVGLVIAQAAGRDLFEGRPLIRYYGRLTVLAGLAAIVGPVIGGQLARVTDWRGIFLFLAGVGVVLLVATLAGFGETLPADRRTSGGLRRSAADFRTLFADRRFTGAVLVTGFVSAALFSYLSGATYILQGVFALSPQEYSYAFGLNSLGFMLFGYLGGLACEHWSERGTLLAGLGLCAAGSLGLLAAGVLGLDLPVVVVSLFLIVASAATTTPPTTTLALAHYPDIAGTASSVLGLARFAFGGLAAPLVGLTGATTVLSLGTVAVAAATLAVLAYVFVLGRASHDRPARERTPAPEAS